MKQKIGNKMKQKRREKSDSLFLKDMQKLRQRIHFASFHFEA